MVETMRWPKASSRVLSIVEGRMPKLDATSRSTVTSSFGPALAWSLATSVMPSSRAELFQVDGRPVGQLVGIRIRQRVLILGLRQPRADGDVLGRLHVQGDALDLRELRLQPVDDLIGAHGRGFGFRTMNTRP